MEKIQEAITQLQRSPKGLIALGDPVSGEAAAYMLTPANYEALIAIVPESKLEPIPGKTRGQRKAAARKREQKTRQLEAAERRRRHEGHERNRRAKLAGKMGNPLGIYQPTTGSIGRSIRIPKLR